MEELGTRTKKYLVKCKHCYAYFVIGHIDAPDASSHMQCPCCSTEQRFEVEDYMTTETEPTLGPEEYFAPCPECGTYLRTQCIGAPNAPAGNRWCYHCNNEVTLRANSYTKEPGLPSQSYYTKCPNCGDIIIVHNIASTEHHTGRTCTQCSKYVDIPKNTYYKHKEEIRIPKDIFDFTKI